MLVAALLVGLVVIVWWCWPASGAQISDFERRARANRRDKVTDHPRRYRQPRN